MKFLFVVPGGNDLGGIITSSEQYVAGLKDAGHDVCFMTVGFNRSGTRPPESRMPRGKFADDFRRGAIGYLVHPTQGWRAEPRLSLMHEDERKKFIAYAKDFDAIIWASVYGFRNPDTEGRNDWFEAIMKLKGKHIFFIHDDHFNDRYPWAHALAPYAKAFVGVQPCSYDSLESVAASRAMIYTPLPSLPRIVTPMAGRGGFFMCQVWKGWKNGDKLVAAAPHMPKQSVTFAGDGIQLRYIRSPDKCPPRFQGLWKAAMRTQHYVGVLQEPARDECLCVAKFLVDLSLRSNSGQLNRIAQEAMAQGCVVIADPRFITGTTRQPVFLPNVHYLPIDATLPPKELAAVLTGYDGIVGSQYAKLQRNAREALKVFDRKLIGQQIARLANSCSFLDGVQTPIMKAQVREGRRIFKEIFA